jgi:hypothetical protein
VALERARRYYSDVLKFELHPGDPWTRLQRLADIRHALAHASGVANISETTKKKIVEWCKHDPGLSVKDGFLVVSLLFAKGALTLVDSLLKDLIKRTRASFP